MRPQLLATLVCTGAAVTLLVGSIAARRVPPRRADRRRLGLAAVPRRRLHRRRDQPLLRRPRARRADDGGDPLHRRAARHGRCSRSSCSASGWARSSCSAARSCSPPWCPPRSRRHARRFRSHSADSSERAGACPVRPPPMSSCWSRPTPRRSRCSTAPRRRGARLLRAPHARRRAGGGPVRGDVRRRAGEPPPVPARRAPRRHGCSGSRRRSSRTPSAAATPSARAQRRLGMERIELSDEDIARIERLGEGDDARSLVERLAPEQRAAITAHVLDERPYDEIAAELDTSRGGRAQAREPGSGGHATTDGGATMSRTSSTRLRLQLREAALREERRAPVARRVCAHARAPARPRAARRRDGRGAAGGGRRGRRGWRCAASPSPAEPKVIGTFPVARRPVAARAGLRRRVDRGPDPRRRPAHRPCRRAG